MTQFFTMHFFGGIEVFILTGMAYDRYVAICKPLHYTIIMSRQRCDAMIAASCAGRFLHSLVSFSWQCSYLTVAQMKQITTSVMFTLCSIWLVLTPEILVSCYC